MGLLLSAVSYLWATWPLSLLNKTPPYEYAALEKTRQIRLLQLLPREGDHLQCRVEAVDLDNTPPFTALSYTHGPPVARDAGDEARYNSLPLVPLLCEGRELLIKPSLAPALSQLDKLGKHGLYWIDQVCINQQDMLERSSQVMMMGDIYSTAKKVLLWLGEEGSDSNTAVIFIKELLPMFKDLLKQENGNPRDFHYSFSNPYIYDRLGIKRVPAEMWDGLAAFLERRSLCRVWTFQEALLPARIDVLCGATMISWKKLGALLKHLEDADWEVSLSRHHKSSLERTEILPGASLSWLMELRYYFFNPDPDYQTYLANISGGSENMDLILASISVMMLHIRLRSATDPRDHFYSLYGIVSILCQMALPQLPNPMMSPDYTMTVAEVYARNIKSLLVHSRSLLLLSHVEDWSQREQKELPSWVPDLTVPTSSLLPLQGTGGFFNASKGALPQILAAPNVETLSLVGHWVDTVTEIGDDLKGTRPGHTAFHKSVPLLLKMPTIYVTGQDRIEAFWRTLIADLGSGGSAHPAPTWLGQAFRQTLMEVFRPYQEAMLHFEGLMTLARSTPEAAALIPSLEEVLREKDRRAYVYDKQRTQASSSERLPADHDEPSELQETIQEFRRQEALAVPFIRQLSRIMAGRRVFRTNHTLLGLGHEATRPGDHIFLLLGARVPFVLRPISPAEGNSRACYEMVGEAYVHGIMQGEALARGHLKLMDINIM